MSAPRKKNQKGFTLTEVVLSIVLLAVLAGVAAPLLSMAVEAIGFHFTRINGVESSDLALTKMSREMRLLRNSQSIVSATANQYEFIDFAGAQIRYRLVGNTLMRREGANEFGLADLVQANGLTFQYLDDDGNVIAVPTFGVGVITNIRRIRIQLLFQDGTQIISVQTQVRPRNLPHEADLFY